MFQKTHARLEIYRRPAPPLRRDEDMFIYNRLWTRRSPLRFSGIVIIIIIDESRRRCGTKQDATEMDSPFDTAYIDKVITYSLGVSFFLIFSSVIISA